MLAQTPLLLLLGTTVVGREGAEHVMKPGAACQLRQQSFPWSPETLMEPRLTSWGGGGDMGAGAPPLQLGATVRLQIRATSPLTALAVR